MILKSSMKIRTELAYVGEVMRIRSSIQELDACVHVAGPLPAVAYPGIFFRGVQQIQLRTERTGIWGR